ncbi:2-hydroxyacid dehydrogenase [Cellulomonas wangsupingiae]|uniref:2-hydroxyacid dehydrogenase n=1 Tax=Cellulomonas wangsupingiae TaxID=2968085 RepID=A0ABY5K6Z9_9CELL|nr:2-hydroxyacid dehydrogenase [Cellulomonas wangsupingiae]MCC2334827.1 2-hydroxyacid dehydrogenase [Cellulomonas wangsupingiae]UUI66222.1 2-hydroxyacid dehydrogenase [Cellulomonas wangsupingiae]
MLTATVPDDDLLARLAHLAAAHPDDLRLVRWDMSGPLDAATAADVDLVVVPHYFVRPGGFDVLRGLPRLRYVQLPSAGYEHARPHLPPGVVLCNGRGVHDAGTAELAVGLALAMQRGLPRAVHAMDEGRWDNPFGPSLADRRVLVVGQGSVGRAVVARFRPFEVDLVRVARTSRDDAEGHVHGVDELADLLPGADVVVLAIPLTRESYHLLDAAALARMKDGALLVNVARGKVVDTDALLRELTAGRLRAALDVTDPEPLPAGHPLWRAPNVLVTAHQGGNTDATYPRVASLVRRQLTALLAGGAPVNEVART